MDSADSPLPVQVSTLTSGVTAMVAGGVAGCAVVGGSMKCWGQGNLGDDTGLGSYVPVPVVGLSGAIAVAGAGADAFFCAAARKSVACWGLNSNGQLGDGTTTNRDKPAFVMGL